MYIFQTKLIVSFSNNQALYIRRFYTNFRNMSVGVWNTLMKKIIINNLHTSNRPSGLNGAHASFSAPAVPYKAGATTGNTLSDLICETFRSWWLLGKYISVVSRFLNSSLCFSFSRKQLVAINSYQRILSKII